MRAAASNPGIDLVQWPEPDGTWRDTGEGGLYAYAVWDHPDKWDRCCVSPISQLTMWDVAPGIHGPMADALREAASGYHDRYQARSERMKKFSKAGLLDEYFQSRAFEGDMILMHCGPVVYLGSAPHSLYSDSGEGGYFQIRSRSELSDQGRLLITVMEKIYGKATYLTLLDT